MNKVLFLVSLTICIFLNLGCFFNRKNLNYTLLDSSSIETPMWIFDHSLVEKDDKTYEYFIGEYDDKDKIECKKGALFNAVEKIVDKIFQEIIKNNNDLIKQTDTEELKNRIRININGVEKVTNYWERKRYKKLPSDKNKIYSCYEVVRIKKELVKQLKQL